MYLKAKIVFFPFHPFFKGDRMKTFAVFLTMVIAVTGLTMAQSPGPDKAPDKKVKGQLPPGWKKLDLSAKQKADIYGVQAAYKSKIQELEMKIKSLKEEEHVEMVKLLTDKQKQELAKGLLPDTPKTP